MDLPLFPLNTVLCPGIALPLHIFEDRYRAMIRHCLANQAPFGVVLIRDGNEAGAGAISFTGIGTIAEIRDASPYDDGRYDLLVVGTRRFEIQRVVATKQPYLVADVELLDEDLGDEAVAHRLAMTATRRFVSYLELLQPREGETADEIDVRVEVETEDDEPTGEAGSETGQRAADDADAETTGSATGAASGPRHRRVMIPDDPTVLSYLLAGILQIESPRRQALLEAPTTETRLRGLLALIDRELLLLRRRLRFYRPEARITGARRS